MLAEKGVAAAASSTSSVEASQPTSLRRLALQQPAPSTPAVASLARGAFAQGSASVVLAHPGHAFMRRALCLQNRAASAAARLPTPAVVSLASPLARDPTCRLQELRNAATSSRQSAQLGAEHCGDGPRCRVNAAVLAVLVALLPGPHRRRRCSALVPPPPRSNRQSWRCWQRHLRRSGLPLTWALAAARAPAGKGLPKSNGAPKAHWPAPASRELWPAVAPASAGASMGTCWGAVGAGPLATPPPP